MGSQHTRDRLVETAERLLGSHGVDAVSLRQIAAAAGERNPAVIQYHFGDREGLIAAIFERRMTELDPRRAALVEALEAAGRGHDLRGLLAAVISPIIDFLIQDWDAGRAYVIFIAQVQCHSRHRVIEAIWRARTPGARRALELIGESLENVPAADRGERIGLMLTYLVHALAEYAQDTPGTGDSARRDQIRRFARVLVDTAVGLLRAPVAATNDDVFEDDAPCIEGVAQS